MSFSVCAMQPTPLARRDLLAAAVAGGTAFELAGARGTAAADQAFDVQLLQTAASIENLLVSTYESMLALPALNSPASVRLRELLVTAKNHHGDHARAYNEVARRLGGAEQTAANSALGAIAVRARSGDLSQVIAVAHELETVAAHTYQNNVGLLEDLTARKLSASILAVESQHAAVLLVARALITANQPELIAMESGALARFPQDAARDATPEPFTAVELARPAGEGAVR